jgi:hypothetical protein
MKKLLFFLTLLFIAFYGQSQVCVPNALTSTGKGYLIPDSATGLIHGCAGKPYEQIIYMKVYKDTTIAVPGFPVPLTGQVDSFVINVDEMNVGLPSYLTAQTNPPARAPNSLHNFNHLLVRGDSLACIKISGTIPSAETPQTYNLSIDIKAYADLYFGPILFKADSLLELTIEDYSIVIDAPGTGACLPIKINNSNKSFAQVQAIPNPAKTQLNLLIDALTNTLSAVTVLDITGKVVATREVILNAGRNYVPFDISNLGNGLYTYMVDNKGQKISGKFVKE